MINQNENRTPKTVHRNNRFLIVNPFGIGDVLFTTPVIEAIKSALPESYIGYVCNIRTAPLMLSNKNIDKVFIFEKDEYRSLWRISKLKCLKRLFKFLKDIKRECFDMAFDLSLSREYGFFLKTAGIRERIGYNYKNRGIFLTKGIVLKNGFCDKHMVEYYLDLLQPAGIRRPDGLKLKIYISAEDKIKSDQLLSSAGVKAGDKFIAVSPGGGRSWGDTSFRKQWPKERFSEFVSDIAKETGYTIVLLGSDTDSDICDYIEEKAGSCVNLCARTGLLTFAALLEKASVLVANDGGPLHIGVAAGARTVSIFGPVDEKVYGPYPLSSNHVVVKNNSLECRPCYKNFKIQPCRELRCLEGIPAKDVITACKELLKI